MKNWILNLIVGLLVLSIVGVIISISRNDLTVNESTLLSVLLTVLSIIGSWIVSSFFSKSTQREAIEDVKKEHQNNLRTYALNAAEKVNNLSNELTKLALYLKSNLENDDVSDEFALYSKIERIESAIHIVNTLKSVNDTSLSDWKGVIGEELEEREEEKEEREERLFELTEKIENIVNNQNQHKAKPNVELLQIKAQLDYLSKTLSPSINIRTYLPRNEKIERKCPNCGEKLLFSQKEKINSHKTIKCTSCNKRSVSSYSESKGIYLTLENTISETFNCPWCNNTIEKDISNIPFTKEIIECSHCNKSIKLRREADFGLSISTLAETTNSHKKEQPPQEVEISAELLDKVEKALPKQPWPEGVHKLVSEELSISHRTVLRSISELIKQKRCNPQIDGVIYVPSEIEKK